MKKTKKHIYTLFLLPLLLLSSCSGSRNNISMFLYANDDDFINELSVEISSIFEDYDLTTYNAERNQAIQNRQITEVIDNEDASLLIVNLVDRLSAKSIVEKANTVNVPIILINREPLIDDIIDEENVYYVGTDSAYEGELQAEIVDELFTSQGGFINSKFDKNNDGKIQVVQIKGEQGHQDTEYRSHYSLDHLRELGYEIDLLSTVYCNWSRDNAYSEFSSIYNNFLDEDMNSEIELVLACNDSMALGVIDYLTENIENYNPEETITDQFFPIIGVDGTSLGLEAIQNGYMYGTVKNDASLQAKAVYEIANCLLNSLNFEENLSFELIEGKYIRTKGEIITSTNLDDYL